MAGGRCLAAGREAGQDSIWWTATAGVGYQVCVFRFSHTPGAPSIFPSSVVVDIVTDYQDELYVGQTI